jgi:hypothetical protein
MSVSMFCNSNVFSGPFRANATNDAGILLLDGGTWPVPFRFTEPVRRQNFSQGFPIVFDAGKSVRRALSVKLFGGAYRGTTDVPRLLFALGRRLLR